MADTAVATVDNGIANDEIDDDYTEDDLLVEEISIDGMCGVY